MAVHICWDHRFGPWSSWSGDADAASVSVFNVGGLLLRKSSERLDQWFRNTKLYKDNLEDYVSGRGMTRKAKIRVVITVTVLMSIGFLIMFGKGIFIGCAVLSAVWIFHVLYFFFGVKTMPEEAE